MKLWLVECVLAAVSRELKRVVRFVVMAESAEIAKLEVEEFSAANYGRADRIDVSEYKSNVAFLGIDFRR